MAGFFFAFIETLAETLFLNIVTNLFVMPFIIKFTISSNLKTKVVVPQGLQFHGEQEKGNKSIKRGVLALHYVLGTKYQTTSTTTERNDKPRLCSTFHT